MAYGTAASLTSSLLVPKGRATALGFSPVGQTPPSRKRRRERPARPGADAKVAEASSSIALDPALRDRKPSARAKLSLRLDRDRHLRLKLLSAHLRRSSQDLLIEALDSLLAGMAPPSGDTPTCACLSAGTDPKTGCKAPCDDPQDLPIRES